jgi:hypothetical protein
MSTPKESMKSFCRSCVSGDIRHVEECHGDEVACPLWPVRMKEGKISVKNLRAYCLYCMGGSRELVFTCPTEECDFYPYRLGKNPNCANTAPPIRKT